MDTERKKEIDIKRKWREGEIEKDGERERDRERGRGSEMKTMIKE